MKLKNDFTKGSKGTRFIRGRLSVENGEAVLNASNEQGNIVISSVIGCNAYGMVPEGCGPLKAGDIIEGFMI
jgi:molybdopterin molybdotransferase